MSVVTAEATEPTAPDETRAAREVYRDVLVELLGEDERHVCLDSDTGLFSATDWGESARRYLNLGIAEQNLMGVAAGLARSGRIPFVNTMATFAATRALEAVKLDIAWNNLPVRIVATHGGLSAGHLGSTHHALEDLAVMRMLPNMTVLVPADGPATESLVRAGAELPGPVYLRLGRGATPSLAPGAEPVRIGVAQSLRRGSDVTLIATGPHPVLIAVETAGELARDGIDVAVLNMHTVKPLDREAIVAAATRTRGIVTVEEHWAAGGLGSAVAEVVAGLGIACPVRRVAVADRFAAGTGGHRHLLERNGISGATVTEHVRRLLA
ncbi:transketolase C-terminal domain-containing protein [Streptomyces sp. BE308]|uniref:transketolase family protein n=1 Tax=Streptomyces sp. BE308 TaxID=3002529 RepID=UPI002E781777|nr:transketolase C-terminal domain-containing protein [Streptomyces sp. BE308]MEE1789462.1 transketolase C-terminal domain-containing protein [Streptomyces sp. BE308]